MVIIGLTVSQRDLTDLVEKIPAVAKRGTAGIIIVTDRSGRGCFSGRLDLTAYQCKEQYVEVT